MAYRDTSPLGIFLRFLASEYPFLLPPPKEFWDAHSPRLSFERRKLPGKCPEDGLSPSPNLWVFETLLLKTALAIVWLPWLHSCRPLHLLFHQSRSGLLPICHRWPGPRLQSQCPFSCSTCPRVGRDPSITDHKDPVCLLINCITDLLSDLVLKNRLSGFWNFSKMSKPVFNKGYATWHKKTPVNRYREQT